MGRGLPDDPVKRRRRKCLPGCPCGRHSVERAIKQRETRRNNSVGVSLTAKGYRVLTMQDSHPLATSGSALAEHRQILHAKIGDGPHACYWNARFACGKVALTWGGLGGDSICVDHLDDDRSNNDPENLVPSCGGCNARRGAQALTDGQIQQVRALYAAGGVTQKALAKQFGVSGATVCRIVNHKNCLLGEEVVPHGKAIA